jgi:hypothetical protein
MVEGESAEDAVVEAEQMIRKREYAPPLYYAAADIAAAAPGNFYARLDTVLGKHWEKLAAPLRGAFVKGWGRPTDPVVYLKCFLIAYFENLTYDTDLAERIADSIALRSFLGYTLTERTPDHASLSRVRREVGKHCALEEVLQRVVALCFQEGLVGGTVTAVDASLLPANAALSSLRCVATGKSVGEHLREVRARNRVRPEGVRAEPETLSNEDFVSGTDPEAKIARKPGVRRDLYYRATHVTDGKHAVILAAGAGAAEEGEAEAAKEVLTQAQETLREHGAALGVVLADAGYDDADLHAHIEELGGTPLTHTQKEGSSKPEGFRKSDFTYLPAEDCYQCPAGQRLELIKHHQARREYRAPEAACGSCPHQSQCVGKTKSQTRSVWRVATEASRDRNTARGATPEGKALLHRRGQIVEAPFGHLKAYGGLRLLNCRGQGKAHVKVVLAAVAWNLLKLVAAHFRTDPTPRPQTLPAQAVAEAKALLQAAKAAAPQPAAAPTAPSSQTPRRPLLWPHLRAALFSWLHLAPAAELRLHPLLR